MPLFSLPNIAATAIFNHRPPAEISTAATNTQTRKTDTMKTAQIKTYAYNELTEAGKDTAYYKWSENRAGDFWESEYADSAKAFISAFNMTARRARSVYDASPDLSEEQANLSGPRAAAYLWNNYRDILAPFKTYYRPGTWKDGRYTPGKERKSRITRANYADCSLTGFCGDIPALKEIRDFIAKPDSRDLETVLCNALQAIEREAEQDAEYQVSREYFEENEANEGTYDKNGREISNLLETTEAAR